MVSPEMQITHETSVAGYLNTMRGVVEKGTGSGSPRDVRSDYDPEVRVADSPEQLVDRINLLLLSGAMSAELRAQITGAVASIAIPNGDAGDADQARRRRVHLAIFLAMASPEYLVQR